MSKIASNSFGTLVDYEIEELCSLKQLIAENFAQENLRQACYELRASNCYYEDAENGARVLLEDNKYILIKPKQLIVIITMESLFLAPDILGRIMAKGQLFSLGIVPVSTYADPGFQGKLGIVLLNMSNNYIKINPGESIAKIEFSRLANAVSRPYHGQHGYDSKIWPKSNHMILSEAELRQDKRIKSSSEEVVQAYGKDMAGVIDLVFRYQRKLIICTIFFVLASLSIMWKVSKNPDISSFVAFATGVIGSLVAVMIVDYATNLHRK